MLSLIHVIDSEGIGLLWLFCWWSRLPVSCVRLCTLLQVFVVYMFARLIMNLSGCYFPLFVYELLNMHKVQ